MGERATPSSQNVAAAGPRTETVAMEAAVAKLAQPTAAL